MHATLAPEAVRGASVLPHGFTAAEVERLARTAAAGSVGVRLDRGDAYEASWFAIVERLYTSDVAPQPGQLVARGRVALLELLCAETRTHGNSGQHARRLGGPSSTDRGFGLFWDWFAQPTPSPERRIVESLALRQVWRALAPIHRATFAALATHETYPAAAEALGLSRKSFTMRVSRARQEFLALWHEHETPSGPWRRDRRGTARCRQSYWRYGKHGRVVAAERRALAAAHQAEGRAA